MSNKYPIGYKKPPQNTRFKKGKSGNPKGRPPRSRNFLTLLKEELGQQVVVTEHGSKRSITKMEAMIKRIVSGALQGDQRSTTTLIEILKRTNQLHEDNSTADENSPVEYEQLLEEYIQREVQNRKAIKTTKKGRKND